MENLTKNRDELADSLIKQQNSEIDQYKHDIKLLKEQVALMESSDVSLRQQLSEMQVKSDHSRFGYLERSIKSLSEHCNRLSEENTHLRQQLRLPY